MVVGVLPVVIVLMVMVVASCSMRVVMIVFVVMSMTMRVEFGYNVSFCLIHFYQDDAIISQTLLWFSLRLRWSPTQAR